MGLPDHPPLPTNSHDRALRHPIASCPWRRHSVSSLDLQRREITSQREPDSGSSSSFCAPHFTFRPSVPGAPDAPVNSFWLCPPDPTPHGDRSRAPSPRRPICPSNAVESRKLPFTGQRPPTTGSDLRLIDIALLMDRKLVGSTIISANFRPSREYPERAISIR